MDGFAYKSDFESNDLGLSFTNMRDLRLASSPLQAAAASGNTALVRRLLSLGADVDAIGGFGTALQVAASRKGNTRTVKLLLERGASVNFPACLPIGRTALQAAVECGDMEITDILLNSGADINAAPSEICGRTAFQAAVESGNVPMAARLIQLGVDIHSYDPSFPQKLNFNTWEDLKHTSMLDLLLENGIDVNGITLARYNRQVALEAAISGRNLQGLRTLLEHGYDVGKFGEFLGESRLFGRDGSLEVLELLLEHKMNPSQAIGSGSLFGSSTLIALAIKKQCLGSVQLLIKASADLDGTVSGSPTQGPTLMQSAAATGSVLLCQTLIAAKVDLKGNRGTAALVAAVENRHLKVMRLLLSAGVSPNWQDNMERKEAFLRKSPYP